MFNYIKINNIKYKLNDTIPLKESLINPGTNETITKGMIVNIENKYNIFKETLITLYLADGLIDGNISYSSFVKKFKLKELEHEKK